MRTLLAALFAVAFLFVAVPEHADAQPKAITVKIQGQVGEPPDEGRPRATWRLRVNGNEVKLYVSKLEILAGATTDVEIFRQLKVNRGLVVVSGEAPAVATLEGAKNGQRVTIQGTMRWADTPAILLVSTASAS